MTNNNPSASREFATSSQDTITVKDDGRGIQGHRSGRNAFSVGGEANTLGQIKHGVAAFTATRSLMLTTLSTTRAIER